MQEELLAQAPTALAVRKPKQKMLALFSSSSRHVTFHFPGEEGWHEALGRVRWSANVALRGWADDNNDDASPAPMTLLVATDTRPPMPLVDAESGAGGAAVHYYDELLKSALQKTVRRRLPWPAVRLAYQLLQQSPDECLRRLPVIVMEDGLAHPRLPFLVWLMIAHTKGWSLGLQHVLDVMQVVYELAACEWRDTIPSRRASRANPFLHEEVSDSQDARGLIASIMLRSCYGGMKGDIRFLRAFAHTWHRRFQLHPDAWQEVLRGAYGGFKGNEVRLYYYSNRNPDEEPLPPPQKKHRPNGSSGGGVEEWSSMGGDADEAVGHVDVDIAVLHPQDLLKEGVDMHCHPKIIDQLAETAEVVRRAITPDQIRSAIWHHRSGVNHKRPVCVGRHATATTAITGGVDNVDDAVDTSSYIAVPALRCAEQHPPDDFDVEARNLAAVWEVVEPELDRLVREGSFWKPRRLVPAASAKKKKKTREAATGLAQPIFAFFKAEAAATAAHTLNRRPVPSTNAVAASASSLASSLARASTITKSLPSSPPRPPSTSANSSGGVKRKRKSSSLASSSSSSSLGSHKLTSFFRPPPS